MRKSVTPRLRTIVFGSLGAGAAVIFTLLLIFGGRNEPVTSRTAAAPPGEVAEIQGVSCTGSVEYYQDGKLKSCTLGREDTLSGQPLAPGTVVNLRPDGSLDWCFLQENTMIQGHLCRGSGHGFHDRFSPQRTTEDGLACGGRSHTGNSVREISFHVRVVWRRRENPL